MLAFEEYLPFISERNPQERMVGPQQQLLLLPAKSLQAFLLSPVHFQEVAAKTLTENMSLRLVVLSLSIFNRFFNQLLDAASYPTGKQLTFKFLSTWGDRHYLGLTGITVYDQRGKPVSIAAKYVITSSFSVALLNIF